MISRSSTPEVFRYFPTTMRTPLILLTLTTGLASAQTSPSMIGVIHTTATLREAVTAWCDDRSSAMQKYGNIAYWDTSGVFDLSFLFSRYEAGWKEGSPYCSAFDTFNDDLSRWDTSKVTNMEGMFAGAASFNKPVGSWDLRQVTTTNGMFAGCKSFNQDMRNWMTSSVQDMAFMFDSASSFNLPLPWDVSSVRTMRGMFNDAHSFNQSSVGSWNTENVEDFRAMFANAMSFDQDSVASWDVSKATRMYKMFWGASAFVGDLSEWAVDSVQDMKDMNEMFAKEPALHKDYSTWRGRRLKATGRGRFVRPG